MTNKKHYNSLEDSEIDRRKTAFNRDERRWEIATWVLVGVVILFIGFQIVRALPAQADTATVSDSD